MAVWSRIVGSPCRAIAFDFFGVYVRPLANAGEKVTAILCGELQKWCLSPQAVSAIAMEKGINVLLKNMGVLDTKQFISTLL